MTEYMPTLGEILRAAREAAGWSLSRMGRATGFSKPYLSKLETGSKDVKPWHVQAYDKALGGDSVRRRALLIMGSGVVAQSIWAELDMPAAMPPSIGASDLAALEDSADVLTRLGLRHGGRASLAAARGQLKYAIGLLDLTMPDDVRRPLLMMVGRLADRTAWSTADSGRRTHAGRIYDFALTVTPDPVQRWLTLVNLANLRLEEDRPLDALGLLDRRDPDLAVLRFLVDAARAHAYASLGDFGRTVRHVDRADAAHAAVVLDDLPGAIRPYASGHGAHAHSAAGRAFAALAHAGRSKAAPLAVQRLQDAINAFGPERRHAIASCEERLESLM